MKRGLVQWARVDGGQYDSVEPAAIPQNGWARLVNWLTFGGRIIRRGGSVQMSLGASPIPTASAVIPVVGLYNAPSGAEDWCAVAASKIGTFGLLKANKLWEGVITRYGSEVSDSDDMPWVMKQRNGVVYALRRNAGKMKRIEGQGWWDAGRPAPTTKATANNPVATGGSLSDGTYLFAYTYYDSVTGQEGNGSPQESITLSGGGSAQKCDVSAFTAPPATSKTTHLRLYMSQLDGAVLYWHQDIAVGSLPATITVTAAPVSFETLPTRNAEPYSGATWFELWRDRGWITDGEYVRYTDFNKPECFSAIQDVSFNPDDGDKVTTIYGWGDVLVVAKRRAMILLAGIDRTSFEQKLWTEMVGCVAPHSMKDCEGTLVWLGEDGIYAAEGPAGQPKNISNQTVKAALATMSLAKRDTAVGEVIPGLGVYVLSFETAAGGRSGLAYSWTSKAWSELSFPQGVTYLVSGFDETAATRTMACVTANAIVYAILEGADDSGSLVSAIAVSRGIQGEGGGVMAVEGVRALMSPTRYPMTLKAYNDGDLSSPVAVREARPIGDQGWSEFALISKSNPAAEVQVALEYSGRDQVWISDFAVEVLSCAGRRRAL